MISWVLLVAVYLLLGAIVVIFVVVALVAAGFVRLYDWAIKRGDQPQALPQAHYSDRR
jgi:hypothetical protein